MSESDFIKIEQVVTKCYSCKSNNNLVLYSINLPSICQECGGEIFICDQCLSNFATILTVYIKE